MTHPAPSSRIVLISILLHISNSVFSQNAFWQATNGPNDGAVTALAINSKGHIFAMSNYLYRSTDNGGTWTKLTGAPSGGFYTVATATNDYLIGGSYGAIHMSADNGDTWQKRKDVYHGYDLYIVTSFASTPDSFVYAGTWGDGLRESYDLGYSWGRSSVGNNYIVALAVGAKGYMFLATDSWIYRSDYAARGWEGGRFQRSGPGGDLTSLAATRRGYVFSAVVSYSYDVYGKLVGSTSGILRSTEDSLFFWPVNNGLPNHNFTGKYRLTSNAAGDVFAGNDSSGVYRSTDNGLHWASINGGLSDIRVQSVAVGPGGHIFVGTQSGSVYRSTQPTTGIVASENSTPGDFALAQNYPNPFNPSTTIQFSLPRNGFVSLKIYNLLGEEMATLVSEELDAGQHSVGWHATGMPSGVYFYRLTAGQFTETKKLVLLR
jgi:photosystem II stability/assembly factor-like uncharacterized protein